MVLIAGTILFLYPNIWANVDDNDLGFYFYTQEMLAVPFAHSV